jgi:hypothetical protein
MNSSAKRGLFSSNSHHALAPARWANDSPSLSVERPSLAAAERYRLEYGSVLSQDHAIDANRRCAPRLIDKRVMTQRESCRGRFDRKKPIIKGDRNRFEPTRFERVIDAVFDA